MEENLVKAQREIAELKSEIRMLHAQLAGDTSFAQSWLQRKVCSQRKALDILNKRVVNQRFVLRTIEELGRGLTEKERAQASGRELPKALAL